MFSVCSLEGVCLLPLFCTHVRTSEGKRLFCRQPDACTYRMVPATLGLKLPLPGTIGPSNELQVIVVDHTESLDQNSPRACRDTFRRLPSVSKSRFVRPCPLRKSALSSTYLENFSLEPAVYITGNEIPTKLAQVFHGGLSAFEFESERF